MYNIYGSTLPIHVLSKYSSDVFIETGTNMAHGVRTALHCNFKKIISIEIDAEKQEKNKINLSKEIADGTLDLITGDVLDHFPKVLTTLSKRATFFFDAHWDFGVLGKTVCSLEFELDQLINHPIKNHIILIDDRRCFTEGHHWGGKISENIIIKKIKQINSDYKIIYEDNTVAKNDLIVAYI